MQFLYTDVGVFEEHLFLPTNPNLILMDPDIIAAFHTRLTEANLGDMLATYFEVRACVTKTADTYCR